MELDQRKRRILTAIVEEYIRTGEPVGSKLLAQNFNLGVSPATIRNEMAVLFELGLLEQPYTSAGRIPSQRGFRLYINQLMELPTLSESERNYIDSLFNVRAVDLQGVMENLARELAQMTNCAVLTTLPSVHDDVILNLDIIKAAPRNIVVVIALRSGNVRSKLFRLDFDISLRAIEFFLSWIRDHIRGRRIETLTPQFLQKLIFSAGENMLLFTPLLSAVYELVSETQKKEVLLTGQTNLLSYNELYSSAYDLLRMLDSKEDVMQLFSRSKDSLQILIGKEAHRSEMTETSMIATRYQASDGAGGWFGLIGPVRLDYAKIIPLIAYFAENMGKLLERQHEENQTAQPNFNPNVPDRMDPRGRHSY